MKLTKKLLAVACVIVMAISALALSGCSIGNEESGTKTEKKSVESLAGKYELVEMSSGSESYGKDELEALKTLGYTIVLELNEDGTGALDMYGEKEDLTYDDSSITVDGVKTPYTRSGNKITFEQDDTKMVFEKAE